ncbi:HTH-type quorum sensing-dependent transcriptional regulator RpaR [Methylobacterium hispanicum]|uniref:HTH-type quorum sensing-dependent transcriptional regulator RpaR n=1 Tax=Methylobacterium hispanicum TaxID=270350 RepID=A0AAV4ZR11_9HYPH|nr:HTH-type quorum sensing-dependent transcriptional regulator RpaR [Methylobacterium hispanicum]
MSSLLLQDLDDAMTAVEGAGSIQALGDIMQSAVGKAGFESFTFVNGATVASTSESILMTVSKEWQSTYFAEGFLDVDPCVKRALTSNSPFMWSDIVLPEPDGPRLSGSRRTMDAARDHGYLDGLVLPLHLVDAKGSPYRSLCSFYWKENELLLPDVSRRYGHYFRMMALLWEQKLQDLSPGLSTLNVGNFAIIENARSTKALSGRERDVLSWAARGKTASETATILGLSIETVQHHLKKAQQKLTAANKTHAVAIAVHRGIVSL